MLLKNSDEQEATHFLEKFVHYRILFYLTSRVYGKIRDRIEMVVMSQENTLPSDANVIAIREILSDIDKYDEIIKISYGGAYQLDNRAKDVFDQIASPRLDDLSLSQAQLKSGLTKAEIQRESNHNELLAEIRKLRPNP